MNDEPKRVEEEQTPADAAAAAEPEAPELTELKDKYLRLATECDNFRKRTLKERAELWTRAQADLVQRLVDALEDLSRFAHIEPSEQTAKTIHDGVDLVERKIRKELEAAGVRRGGGNGRGAGRGRGENSGVAVSFKKKKRKEDQRRVRL